MTLQIETGSSIHSMQYQFTILYPYLKIEFDNALLPTSGKLVFAEATVKTTPAVQAIAIDVSGYRTVAEVEKEWETKPIGQQRFTASLVRSG